MTLAASCSRAGFGLGSVWFVLSFGDVGCGSCGVRCRFNTIAIDDDDDDDDARLGLQGTVMKEGTSGLNTES